MAKVSVSVVIPVFNEEEIIEDVLTDVKKAMNKTRKKHEIIVVDDGSTDDSIKIIRKKKYVKLIQHNSNKGYGAALKTGIKASKGERILIIDGDGTYPAGDIPKLVKLAEKHDMVVGARTGKKVAIPFFRRPAKWFIGKLANYLTGVKIPDLNSGLRIFKKEIAERFFTLFPNGFSFTATITIASLTNDYDVVFVPINYYKRKGKSSISPIKDFSNFIYLIIRMVTYFKPLNVFLPLAGGIFLVGFLKAIRDFILLNKFGAGAVMVMLTAIQIAVLGLIADLIIKRTKL